MSPLSRTDFDLVRQLTPLVSMDLIIRDPADRVLLGYRRNEPAKDIWFVPGGRVRKDETLAAAFSRLLQTELGNPQAMAVSLNIVDATFKGIYEHLYPVTAETPFTIHYVVLAYELRGQGLPTSADRQHDRWAWFEPAALREHAQVHANTRAYFSGSH
jgi:colanic acid biosynthesis protein WcaH